MLKKQFIKKKWYLIFTFCVAIVFGIVYSLTPVLQQGSNAVWSALDLMVGTVLFLAFFVALICFLQRKGAAREERKIKISDRCLFGVLFAAMTIIGLLYLLIYWPGTGMYDAVYIIKCEHWLVAKQHPWFYCLIIKKIVNIVFALGGGFDAAVPLISFIQILVSALVYSYALVWLRRKDINNLVWCIIAAVYIFFPAFGMYMVTVLKDIPYSLLVFIWVPVLYDVWETDGEILKDKKTIVKVCILLVLSLLRNNGIYVSLFIVFGLLVCYRKLWRQVILFTTVLILVMFGSSSFEKEHNITHLFKETVGIPLQQIAATVYYDGDITDEQEAFIGKVIPIDFIKEKYNPYSADTLKWGNSPLDNNFLNENKIQFLKVWAQMLVPNFKIYVEAYLRNTYGFWSLTSSDHNKIYTTFYVEAFDEWYKENNIEFKKMLPAKTQEFLESVTTTLANISPGSGVLLWSIILLLIAFAYVYGIKMMSIGLSLMGGWITIMISTPVAFQWRYTLYMAMALPLIVGIIFVKSKYKNIKNDF